MKNKALMFSMLLLSTSNCFYMRPWAAACSLATGALALIWQAPKPSAVTAPATPAQEAASAIAKTQQETEPQAFGHPLGATIIDFVVLDPNSSQMATSTLEVAPQDSEGLIPADADADAAESQTADPRAPEADVQFMPLCETLAAGNFDGLMLSPEKAEAAVTQTCCRFGKEQEELFLCWVSQRAKSDSAKAELAENLAKRQEARNARITSFIETTMRITSDEQMTQRVLDSRISSLGEFIQDYAQTKKALEKAVSEKQRSEAIFNFLKARQDQTSPNELDCEMECLKRNAVRENVLAAYEQAQCSALSMQHAIDEALARILSHATLPLIPTAALLPIIKALAICNEVSMESNRSTFGAAEIIDSANLNCFAKLKALEIIQAQNHTELADPTVELAKLTLVDGKEEDERVEAKVRAFVERVEVNCLRVKMLEENLAKLIALIAQYQDVLAATA